MGFGGKTEGRETSKKAITVIQVKGKRPTLEAGKMEKERWMPESEEIKLVGFGDYWM